MKDSINYTYCGTRELDLTNHKTGQIIGHKTIEVVTHKPIQGDNYTKMRGVFYALVNPGVTKRFTATAVLQKGDQFDVETGKNIIKAKLAMKITDYNKKVAEEDLADINAYIESQNAIQEESFEYLQSLGTKQD